MNEKIKVEIRQPRMKSRLDSFWYEGEIAYMSYKDREVLIIATGDIRIHNKKGELVYDNGGERGPGFKGFKLKTDKDLKRIGGCYDDAYRWENNNWFEPLYKLKGDDDWDCLIGDVSDNYDAAIEQGKAMLKDDYYWEEAKV